jgi:cytoskeletal protein CcmA (bactofilin family)
MFSRREDSGTVSSSSKTILTIIGKGTEGTGRLAGKGSIRIDGKYEGEIDTEGDVIIGESGCVIANVKASTLSIAGALQGNVSISGKLEILPTGKLIGDAKIGSLVIEEGAMLRGHCEIIGADAELIGFSSKGIASSVESREKDLDV